MRGSSLCLALLSVIATFNESQVSLAAERISGTGDLAVQGTHGQWRFVSDGDALPPVTPLSTSTTGMVRIRLGQVADNQSLVLDAVSQAQLDETQKTLLLESGRVYLSAESEWSVKCDNLNVTLNAKSEFAVTYARGDSIVEVISGDVSVQHGTETVQKAHGPVLFGIQNGKLVQKKVSPEKISERTAWASEKAQQGLGQLVVRDSQDSELQRMEIARSHVNVVVQAPVALVQLDQSFFNPGNSQAEGTFVFNLPPGASVSRFAMFVTHDELIEGELIDRRKARRVYQTIVSGKRDPAILEQIGDNLFRMRVFPIFARDTKRILLDFTIPLAESDEQYSLRLPLMSDLKPIWDFRLSGSLLGSVEADKVTSRSHPKMKFAKSPRGEVTFLHETQNEFPPESFEINLPKEPTRTATLTSYVSHGHGLPTMYFMATIPPKNEKEVEPESPADVMILVDTSASSGDLSKHRALAKVITQNLRKEDRIQLGCMDDDLRFLTNEFEWSGAHSVKVAQALERLDEELAMGASPLEMPLNIAMGKFSQLESKGRRKQLIYIGDGHLTGSREAHSWVKPFVDRLKTEDITLSVVLTKVTSQSGHPLEANVIQDLADAGGQLFDTRRSHIAEREIFQWALRGLPKFSATQDVTITGKEAEIYYPTNQMQGRDLHLFGKCDPVETMELKIQTNDEIEKFTMTPRKEFDQAALFTGRMWAQRKLMKIRDDGSKAVQEQIIDLSQQWSLLSPYTAFLVLETEADYPRWGIDRRKRHRYWQPPQAIKALPYPPHVVEMMRKPLPSAKPKTVQNTGNTERLKRLLVEAEKALQRDEPVLANRYLFAAKSNLVPGLEPQYKALQATTDQALALAKTLHDLGTQRSQFDLMRPPHFPNGEFFPLLLGAGGISDEFRKYHPHVDKLVQKIEIPDYPINLDILEKYIELKTGLQVIVNEQILAESGIGPDEPISLDGFQKMVSLRALFHHTLKNIGGVELITLTDPNFVTITTIEDGEERLSTRPFQVVDLIRTDQLPSPALLSHPYLDIDSAFRARIDQKMDQPVTLDTTGMTLKQFSNWLYDHTGENVLLRESILSENGLGPNEKLTDFQFKETPLKSVVKLALEDIGGVELTTMLDLEALVITTVEDEEEQLDTRLYSGVGVLFDVPEELLPLGARQFNNNRFWGGGNLGGQMGGGGGAFGGGGFGGQMGGQGGGGFGGNSSVENGDGGAEGVSQVPSQQVTEFFDLSATASSVTPAVNDNQDAQPSEETDPLFDQQSARSGFNDMNKNSGDEVIELIQQSTAGPWFEIDGLGGTIDFFAPSHSLIVRQTGRMHQHIQDQLNALRELPTIGRVQHARIPKITQDVPAGWDIDSIHEVIQQQTEGPWFEVDGIGGTIDQHYPSMSIMVRQTQNNLEQVNTLLTMLRREAVLNRYQLQLLDQGMPIPDNMTWHSSLTLTPLSREEAPPEIGIKPEELKLLKQRPEPDLHQQWSIIDPDNSVRMFLLKKQNSRWQLASADGTTLRVDGDLALVEYPSHAVVEKGPWGQTVRTLASGLFPWLPHLTNEQIAAQYEVEAIPDSQGTLRLKHYQNPKLIIEASFAPLKWRVLIDGELQYELKVTEVPGRTTIQAVDANGNRLMTWENTNRSAPVNVPPLDVLGEYLLIDQTNPQNSPYLKVRSLLMEYKFTQAAAEITTQLEKTTSQPFWNFLLAWCCEHGTDAIPNRLPRLQSALQNVARSEATGLIRLITLLNFQSLDEFDLYQVLESVPLAERSLSTLDMLTNLAERLHRDTHALEVLRHAISRPDGATHTRQLRLLGLLCKTKQSEAARTLAEELLNSLTDPDQLAQAGDVTGRKNDKEISDRLYAKALKSAREDSQLTAQLLVRAAFWQVGEPRWDLLVQAADRWDLNEMNKPLHVVLEEAIRGEDAEILSRLAEEASRPLVQLELTMRRIDIMSDRSAAGTLSLELLESGKLPKFKGGWALRTIIEGGNPEYVISLIESGIRSGRRVDDQLLSTLSSAYRKADQPEQARRAYNSIKEFRNPTGDRRRVNGGGFF